MTDTGLELKTIAIKAYIEKYKEKIDRANIMLRNPNFDLGQLINDDDKIDNLFLFDSKEIYLQLPDAEAHLPYISDLGKDKL